MLKLDLQFFGGRGSSSTSGGTSGGMSASDILETTSLVSAREGQQSDVDEVLSVFNDVYDEYGSQISDIQIATLKAGSSALAYYDAEGNIAINKAYFDSAKMTEVYDASVKSGFHPGRGNKTALEAVTAHELGHKLTEDVGAKMGKVGFGGIDAASASIVKQAAKSSGYGNNTRKFSAKISGYGKTSYAEAVAEAFADVYCNGSKAGKESRAIVSVINSYLK